MNLLPLDDERWKNLAHRNWSHGKPSDWAPHAPFAPDVLAKLVASPESSELFSDLWPWLCSEGTAWPAAHAVVPYAVMLASRVPPEKRFEYLFFVGLVAHCTASESSGIEPFLKRDYDEALRLALSLVADTLSVKHNQTETRYLLSTIAALKGHYRLADVLENLDCVHGECSKCGELVWPSLLQSVV